MLALFDILVIIFTTLTLVHFFKQQNKNKKTLKNSLPPPPGPKETPLFGSIFQFGTDALGSLQQWSKKYGPMFQLNIFGQKLLFLNDGNCVREMFSETAFLGKPAHHILMLFSNGPWGVISTEGETWEVHRRFTLRGLRDFGFSKSSMEGLISDEIEETIEWFKENNGKTLEVGQRFNLSVSNSLWTIISGRRNDHDSKISEILHDFVGCINVLFQRGVFLFPSLRFIVPEWSGYNDLKSIVSTLHAFILKAIKEHMENFNESSPRDFIDLYLQEIKNAKPGSHFYGEIGERHMLATISDLFLAGNETTAVTLNWSMLYLCRHPRVQDILHKEIVKVIGTKRKPILSDRISMPYTEAVIIEVLRKSTLLPFGVPHRAIRNQNFRGYSIEKDTIILPHLKYIMNNKDVWGDAENFRPERFLSEDGRKVEKTDDLIPFQAGRRQCPGEALARDTLFLFLTNIFQQFEILPDPENPKPDLEPVLGFVNGPKRFKVFLRLRNN